MKELVQRLKPKSETINNLLLSFAITFAVMVLSALILGCQYQTNDDYAMSLTVSGAYGEISNRLIFSNTILGIGLSWLYTVAPIVHWYAWMHLAFLFFPSAACVFLILETIRKKMRILIALIFLGIATMPVVMQIQFTMESYFCILAGFALFGYAFLKPQMQECRKKRVIMLIAAIIFVLLGVMIREKAVFSMLPFVILLAGVMLYKRDKRPLLWLITGCVVCAGAVYVNSVSFSSEKWQEYLKFNASRSELLDSPRLDYDDNIAVFNAVGWSETDYNVFYSWMIADEDHFTTEKLDYIIENGMWPPVTIGSLITDFAQSMDSVLKFFPFCFLFLCLSLCLRTRDDKILPLIVTGAVLCAHILFIVMQRAPVRTVYPHYILGILLLMLLIDYSKFRIIRRKRDIQQNVKGSLNITGTAILVICMGITLLVNTAIADTSKTQERYAYFIELDQYIIMNKDKIFLSSVSAGSERYKAYSVFDVPEKGMLENYSSLGGWYTKSPRYFAFKTEHGMVNMFLSLLDDNVYLIEKGEPTLIQQYLYEDFQIQTQALLVAEFEDIGVYKLYKGSVI